MTWGPTRKQVAFAQWLSGLVTKERRGTLAALRRGLMLDEEHFYELLGHVPPGFLAELEPGEDRLYLMVAALFAYHPASFPEAQVQERRYNLGESLRLLAVAKQSPGSEPEELLPDSLKRRLEALLAAPRDELFGHLRQIISLLKTEEISVDWAQLLYDLQAWDRTGHPVQWAWSRAFYVGRLAKEGDETHVS